MLQSYSGRAVFGANNAQVVRLLKGQKLMNWVARLPAVIANLNNEVTRLTGQKPSHTINAKVAQMFSSLVAGRTIGLSELRLLSGLAIRCLYQSEELESDHFKAADMV